MANVDCTDCAKVTAKTLANVGATSNSCLSVADVCNPIKDELTPSQNERRSNWYAGLHIVPYMGEDSQSLKLFTRLNDLSPTQSACVQSIKDYALGGELLVEKKKREGFASMGDDEVSDSEANEFIDFLETFSNGAELLQLSNQCYDNLQETGNAWIQVILSETAGVRNAKLVGHDQQDVRYKYSKLGEDRMAYISQEWSSTWINEHPPVLVPVYPTWGDMGDGVYTTLIHKANLPVNRDWYGVPPAMSAIYFQWLEVMRGDYTQKEYGNGFTGKHFVEFEADHNSSDYNEIASSFKRVFTRSGDARTMVLRQRSVNQKPATIHSFAQNTDEKFQSFVANDCEKQIIKANNWDGALIGISKSGSLGSNQELNRLYRWKYQTVVKPWQNKSLSPVNLGIDLIIDWLGREDMKSYSLGLTNPMRELLEEEAEAAKGIQGNVTINEGEV